jgi:hypothetical protein
MERLGNKKLADLPRAVQLVARFNVFLRPAILVINSLLFVSTYLNVESRQIFSGLSLFLLCNTVLQV